MKEREVKVTVTCKMYAEAIIFSPRDKINKQSKILNKNIAFTGFRSKFLKTILENNYGANVQTSLQKNTDILICKDDKMNSAKIKKAKQNKIIVKDIKKFINAYMYNYYNFDNENPKNDYSVKKILLKNNVPTIVKNKIKNVKKSDAFKKMMEMLNVYFNDIFNIKQEENIIMFSYKMNFSEEPEYTIVEALGKKNKIDKSLEIHNMDSNLLNEQLFYSEGYTLCDQYVDDKYISYHLRLSWINYVIQ